MSERAATLLSGRRGHIERILGRPVAPPTAGAEEPITSETRSHLLSEVQDLYWNEVEWEHITDEESLDAGALAELTFPGLLAYVRGLLLSEVMPDSLAPANPRPQVVSDALDFLASRVVELEDGVGESNDEDRDRSRSEIDMTTRLIDRVLYLYHGLSEEEVERVARASA